MTDKTLSYVNKLLTEAQAAKAAFDAGYTYVMTVITDDEIEAAGGVYVTCPAEYKSQADAYTNGARTALDALCRPLQ